MPDLKITEEELTHFSRILASLQNTYITLGKLREREKDLLNALEAMKVTHAKFEKEIEEKYHIPAGVAWKIDPSDRTILMPSEEDEEEPAEEAPGAKGACGPSADMEQVRGD